MKLLTLREIWPLVKKSVAAWSDDYAPSMGAALAYYTIFSIAPLLLIVISIAGLIYGQDAARGAIFGQISGITGPEGAAAIQALLKSVNKPSQSIITTIVGLATLLLGATTVFGELQDALNRIWRAPVVVATGGLWSLVRRRLLAFGMILTIGFLLIVSLLMSAALAAIGEWIGPSFYGWEALLHVVNFSIGFAVTTVFFAMIYKIMPHVNIAWRDVWLGAAVTSLLFSIGRFLIGLYIGKTSIALGFGAAGSLAVLLVWVYYSTQVFLMGAEFTWVYANHYGSRVGGTAMTNAAPDVPSRGGPDGGLATPDGRPT